MLLHGLHLSFLKLHFFRGDHSPTATIYYRKMLFAEPVSRLDILSSQIRMNVIMWSSWLWYHQRFDTTARFLTSWSMSILLISAGGT
jgi:hypothetical protein